VSGEELGEKWRWGEEREEWRGGRLGLDMLLRWLERIANMCSVLYEFSMGDKIYSNYSNTVASAIKPLQATHPKAFKLGKSLLGMQRPIINFRLLLHSWRCLRSPPLPNHRSSHP